MSNASYAGSDIRHAGFYSYTTKDNIIPYYTTVSDDELIDFSVSLDKYASHANFLWIESVDSPLYVSINDTDSLVYIPTGHAREISYIDIVKIRVMNLANTKLRWYIQTF